MRTDLTYEGIATYTYAEFAKTKVGIDENWPDLRRDCDTITFSPKDKSMPMRTDLTYEGIATRIFILIQSGFIMRTDLTYEGIATLKIALRFAPCFSMRTDLTYEGIATPWFSCFRFLAFRMRTDLTYEGIATRLLLNWLFVVRVFLWELTWLTKGLRLEVIDVPTIFQVLHENWPDLRRDCDAASAA